MEELKEGWRRIKLGEVTDIGSSKRIFMVDYRESGIPFFRGKEIIQKSKGNNITTELYITEEKYNEIKNKFEVPQKGDILLTSVGTIGVPYLVNNNEPFYFKDGNVTWIKKYKNEVYNKYIYQWIKSPLGQNQINQVTIGSTQKALTIDALKKLEIDLPPLETQEKIASILSALDDKIEINNEMNKTLEEMAQTLFKRWFIDFDFPNENGEPYKSSGGKMIDSELGEIPEGWEVGKYRDLVKLNGLSTKKGNKLRDLPYVPIDCIPKKSLGLKEFKSWKEAESSLQLFNENDILFGAMRVYFHKVVISPFKGVTRKTCFILTPLEKNDLSYVALLTFQESTIDYANSNSKGTTMPYAVWENGLENMSVIIPSQNIREKFNRYIYPLLNSIKSSFLSNKYLTEIRDTLLPKLMSGEIELSEGKNDRI